MEKESGGSAPQKKVRGRANVRADGMSDFNPDSNLRLTRKAEQEATQAKEAKKENSSGCCK